MKKLLLLLFVLLVGCKPLFATLGGPQELEVLGWDPQAAKIYFLYVYKDEAGPRPDLLIYDLKGRILTVEKQKPVIGTLRGKELFGFLSDYDKYIAKLRSELKPLSKPESVEYKISYRQLLHGYLNQPADGSWSGIPYWKYQATVSKAEQPLYWFDLDLFYDNKIQTILQLETPDKAVSVAVLRYTGIWHEIGYTKDQLLLFPPEQEKIEKPFDINRLKKI